MPFRRRRKPLHERLAEEGGLLATPHPAELVREAPQPRALDASHGVARPRAWDAVATVEAEGLTGDEVRFTALPDGTLLVEEDAPEGALTPLADAVEQSLAPPYRAQAVRTEGELWGVAANAIEVVEVAEQIDGDTVSLAVQGGERTLLVDERPSLADISTLEGVARSEHDAFVLHAERLDGDLWSVKVNPL